MEASLLSCCLSLLDRRIKPSKLQIDVSAYPEGAGSERNAVPRTKASTPRDICCDLVLPVINFRLSLMIKLELSSKQKL